MKNTIFLFSLLSISFLYSEICAAQAINLEEYTSGPPLYDSHNGSVALGDIDNDGDPDLIVNGKDNNSIKSTLYRNDGNGNFTEITGTSFAAVEFGSTGFADVDNDGDQDLLMTGRNNQAQSFADLYINDGTGNFNLDTTTPFEPVQEGDFAFSDVDNDGDQDLLMTGYKVDPTAPPGNLIGHTALYINNAGSFLEAMGTSFEQVKGSSIAFIDIDNDMDNDVIIAGENDNNMNVTKLYSNDGSGNFSLIANTSFNGFVLGDIAVADSDNDGDQDLLISGLGTNGNLSELYINDGTGVFSLVLGTPFPTTFLSTSDFADFDNDGDFDILVTGSVQGATFTSNIYENQGANNFVLVDSLIDAYFTATAIDDIDGDNDLDVVMVGIDNQDPFKTRIYLNSSSGFALSAKVLLEGPYNNNGAMRTNLTSLLPTTQPYNTSPWFYTGSEALSTIPNNMVDWILLEARTGTPNTSGNPGTSIVETLVGILLDNGDIVGIDGTPLRFRNLTEGNDYYLAIRHRNHLPVLSASPITAATQMTYDFTTATNMAFGTAQQKMAADGKAILYSGDSNKDNVIQVTDYDQWRGQPAALNIYTNTDFNLDGTIQVTDYDQWFVNKAKLGIGEF